VRGLVDEGSLQHDGMDGHWRALTRSPGGPDEAVGAREVGHDARPVPADGLRAAASALLDNCDWVVIDATSDTEIVLRQPSLRAIAAQQSWTPPHADPDVAADVGIAVGGDPRISAFTLTSGDPQATGLGPDLIIRVSLEPGLSSQDFTQLLADFSARLGESQVLGERVDNLLVRVTPTN
jgi:hypothetical protein